MGASAFVPGNVWVPDLPQKKFQKFSCICIVLRENLSMLLGVFAQSDHGREYVGCFRSAEDIHQVDKVDVRFFDGLKYPWSFNTGLV